MTQINTYGGNRPLPQYEDAGYYLLLLLHEGCKATWQVRVLIRKRIHPFIMRLPPPPLIPSACLVLYSSCNTYVMRCCQVYETEKANGGLGVMMNASSKVAWPCYIVTTSLFGGSGEDGRSSVSSYAEVLKCIRLLQRETRADVNDTVTETILLLISI